MIGLQVGRCAVCHHPQSGGDGPPPWGQDGAGEKDVDVRPNGLRTNRREDRHDTEARGRPREQSILSCLRNAVLSLPRDFGTPHHHGQSRDKVMAAILAVNVSQSFGSNLSKNLTTASNMKFKSRLPSTANARPELLLEAGARHERTL